MSDPESTDLVAYQALLPVNLFESSSNLLRNFRMALSQKKTPTLDSSLKPLSWLVGRWQSISASGSFPTVKPFEYTEELEISGGIQPFLKFSSISHNLNGQPMHQETGYLRVKPDTTLVALCSVHNFGLTTVEEGQVEPNELLLVSEEINRMSFSKTPCVTKTERHWRILENGNLEMVMRMKTTEMTVVTEHLRAVYKKC